MKVTVTSFGLPKAGNTQEKCEDAFYPRDDGEKRAELLHFAVADGASMGMLNGKWAEILVNTFCESGEACADIKKFLDRAYKNWNSWKRKYLRDRQKQDKPIQWYEEVYLQAGSFSTLLGLTLIDSEEGQKWETVAFGDSCLFQIRGEDLVVKLPIDHSSDFNNRPLLVSTNPSRNNELIDAVETTKGDWCIGDQFYLMTDALACWFLREYEAERCLWSTLCRFNANDKHQSFEEWIDELRKEGKIRNDDVTLICLRIIEDI